jgi:hypothetical protein
MNEIETYKIVSDSSTDDYDVSNKYMKMITDVGAMATVGVSARGMKVSLRCVGSVDYSERLLSSVSVVAISSYNQNQGTTDTSVDTSESPSVTDVSDLQQSSSSFETYGSDGSHSYIRCTPESECIFLIDYMTTMHQVWKSRFKTYAKQCGAVNMHNLS